MSHFRRAVCLGGSAWLALLARPGSACQALGVARAGQAYTTLHPPRHQAIQAQPATGATQRLAALAQVWGFLKYHHPGIARPMLDWDSVLVASIKPVEATRTTADFSRLVQRWLDQLGPLAGPARPLPPEATTRSANVTGLFNSPLLSPAVRQQLLRVWQQHAFATPHPTVATEPTSSALVHKERAYANLLAPDEAYRLLGLFRYWNIIQYYYPYKYAIGTDWSTVLTAFIPRFQRAATPLAYHLLVLELVAQLHDTHAFLYGSPELSAHFGDYYPPLELAEVEGQVVVTGVYADASPTPLPVHVGDVVEQADGVAVARRLAQTRQYVAASTPAAARRDGLRFLLRGAAQDSLALTIRTATGRSTVKLRRSLNILSLWSASYKRYFYGSNLQDTARIWRELPGNIGYLHLGGLTVQHLAPVMRRFRATAGLILDLRAYPQAGIGQLATYLPTPPIPRVGIGGVGTKPTGAPWVTFTAPYPDFPGYLRPGPTYTNSASGLPPYLGKVVVLVNEKTQSYGETMAMLFQSVPGAVVVGSQTAGANGNIVQVVLPGGLETYYSGLGVYYSDGRETQRVGIVPAIVATPTLAGLRQGRDEVLDRAVAYITTGR